MPAKSLQYLIPIVGPIIVVIAGAFFQAFFGVLLQNVLTSGVKSTPASLSSVADSPIIEPIAISQAIVEAQIRAEETRLAILHQQRQLAAAAATKRLADLARQRRVEEAGLAELLKAAATKSPPPSGVVNTRQAFEPEMVPIPAGSFQMGSPNSEGNRNSDEGPVHMVNVVAFKMGKYEVTQQQWQAVMGSNPSYFKCTECPVEQISWIDVQDYLRQLNAKTAKHYRLPTEAEWEYACRGGKTGKLYCGGNDVDAVAWYAGNSGDKTHPVGTKISNGFGLYDMSGNVWEWTCSKYKSSYDGSENLCKNHAGSALRVGHGGSWGNVSARVSSTGRIRDAPDYRDSNHGFRLTQDSIP